MPTGSRDVVGILNSNGFVPVVGIIPVREKSVNAWVVIGVGGPGSGPGLQQKNVVGQLDQRSAIFGGLNTVLRFQVTRGSGGVVAAD